MHVKYHFRLYTLGKTNRFSVALTNLTKLCNQKLKDQYQIEVVDLNENIQLAEDNHIWATPTIERLTPEPVMRIIGDLSDEDTIVQAMIL